MKCNEFYSLISSYLEFELDEEQHESFEQHRRVCDNCTKDLEDLTKVMNALQSIPEEELPENFEKVLRKRLINEAGAKKFGIIYYIQKNAKIISTLAAGLIVVGSIVVLVNSSFFSSKMNISTGRKISSESQNTKYDDKSVGSLDEKDNDEVLESEKDESKLATNFEVTKEPVKEPTKEVLIETKEEKVNPTKKEAPANTKEPEIKKSKSEERLFTQNDSKYAPTTNTVNDAAESSYVEPKVVSEAPQTFAVKPSKASTPVEGTSFKQNVSHVFIARGSYDSAMSIVSSLGGVLVSGANQIEVDPVVTLPLDAEVSSYVIKIPNSSFDSLVNGLSNGEYEFGGLISMDISKKVLGLKNQRDGLDSSIETSGASIDKTILDKLNSQRDRADSNLRNMIGDTDYTLISILIRN